MAEASGVGESFTDRPWQTGQRISDEISSVRLSSAAPVSGGPAGAPMRSWRTSVAGCAAAAAGGQQRQQGRGQQPPAQSSSSMMPLRKSAFIGPVTLRTTVPPASMKKVSGAP